MNNFFIIFFSCLASFCCAQVYEVDTLQFNGDLESYINIVVLGDGYTEGELDKFSDDAGDFANYLFSQKPYDSYQTFFNVFAVRVPSNQSGASHPATATDVSEPVFPQVVVDNAFGSTFDAFGIHRLLVAEKTNIIFNTLAQNFPLYDQVIILVNSEEYGGSGGQFAVSSLHSSANEIAVHEIGHSFTFLIDEYYAGDQYSREGANMTKETNPSLVKWKNWMGYEEVGIYQHCCSGEASNWYRPHENCKMRVLGPEFCPVCIEATVERIHELAPILQDMYPKEMEVEMIDSLVFNIDLKKPEPNTLAIQWILNEEILATDAESLKVMASQLSEGSNELIVTVEDRSPYLRIDNHASIHTQLAIWEISRTATGVLDVAGGIHDLQFSIVPNPVDEEFRISLMEAVNFNISFHIYDASGRLIDGGDFTNGKSHQVNSGSWETGSYHVQFRKGQQILSSRKIVKL